jgi:hypothetical protein
MSESITTYAQLESSRIQILDAPILNPGTCALCGSSSTGDRKYADLGITVDYVGVIYFCTFCLQEVANRVGCATPEQTKQLEDELDAARQTILEFQAQKAAYDDAIGTLRSTGLFSNTDLSSIIDSAHAPATEQDIISEFEQPKQDAPRFNKSTKQSNSKQRSDDIPESGSDDFNFGL